MNPVAKTITNARKEYWPSRGSNQRPPVVKRGKGPEQKMYKKYVLIFDFRTDLVIF